MKKAMKLKIAKTAHLSTHLFFRVKGESPALEDFLGEKGDLTVRYDAKRCLIYCGLGEQASVTPAIMRNAAAQGIRKALKLKRGEVSIVASAAGDRGDREGDLWKPALEGAVLGAYSFSKYKSEKGTALTSVELVSEANPAEAQRALSLCECVNYARDLVNDNAHNVYPESFAREARAVAKKGRMKCIVLDERAIEKKGLGLLKAVGQASPFGPRLVLMEYRGDPKSKDLTALVGKGITFDSGGQNLKPTGSIETMRCDMAGAATVLGAMQGISMLKLKKNILGVCSLAHNAIGRHAYFPGDVYRSYSGKTVEINNTDAEGRLVLADAISYCIDRYKPSRLIDLATLTGGIITALGTTVAGIFSNNKELSDDLFNAGERVNERLWAFPLYDEYSESMKSDIADVRNSSKKKKGWASSITGAAFIKEFIGETAWAHIDIAGTAFNEDGENGEIVQGATGFGIRLLVEYFLAR
jgi:leucyl aminopeptidase